MVHKIFRSVFLASMLVLLASFALIFGVLYQYTSSLSIRQLRSQIALASAGVSTEGKQYFEGFSTENTGDYRITWIDSDGTVLYDSSTDSSEMGNHLQRQEVQEALENGYGESQRYSVTLRETSLYAAQKLSDGTILRMSIAQASVTSLLLGMMQPVSVIILFGALFSFLLARSLSKRIVSPLNAIDLDHPLDNDGYDELAPLLHRINSQQMVLAGQKQELARKQDELNTILENMSEGMVLLRADGTVLSINSAALGLLGADRSCIGKSLLTISRNIDLAAVTESALRGQPKEIITSDGDSFYQISASPVHAGEHVQGAVIVFFDVTDREKAEQMRREFSANVSHELKTPLHAISGYAELIRDGLVKPEDIGPFSGKIYAEAQRTIALVEDIISLSHLDEGTVDMNREKTDLYQTALSVSSRLEDEANKSGITVFVSGESAVLTAIPSLLSTIVYNLCDNAIKYNRPGGHVWIEVKNLEDSVSLQVKDDGIGMSREDQKRMFERFYRADKSHSRAIGGTGLGLSIVKHAVQIHHGMIETRSTPGKGTCITVTLPKRAQTEETDVSR